MSFFDNPYTVVRLAAGYRDPSQNNKWIDGAETELTVYMNIQPVRGKELDALPEGRRDKQAIKGYSDTQLYTVKEAAAENPDIIVYDGERYEVFESKPYGNFFGYWKIQASLL